MPRFLGKNRGAVGVPGRPELDSGSGSGGVSTTVTPAFNVALVQAPRGSSLQLYVDGVASGSAVAVDEAALAARTVQLTAGTLTDATTYRVQAGFLTGPRGPESRVSIAL